MASSFRLAEVAANAAADAVAALLNDGRLRIYSGPRPDTADGLIKSATMLAELTFGLVAYGRAVGGVATAKALAPEASAKATGRADWFRAVTAGGVAVYDGLIGTSGADLNLSSVDVQMGALVSVEALTYTQPKVR